MNLRKELIEVAAVACAFVEDLDNETTGHVAPPLNEIVTERKRQEEKWGAQHHSPEEWLAILAEEMGEAAREVVVIGPKDPKLGGTPWHVKAWLLNAETEARRFLKAAFGQ